jgi:hypothetical protein
VSVLHISVQALSMYNPVVYNSLPSLRESASLVTDEVRALRDGPVRQFFLDHDAHKQYGIALLHKHFSIGEEERLVEIHHVSSPWKVGTEQTDVASHHTGKIVPRSVRYYEGVAAPYEFAYVWETTPVINPFPRKALDLLKTLGLDLVFGIRFLDNRDSNMSVEITEGKVNIMMAPEVVPDSEPLIEALWIFGPNENDRCHCREHCWPTKDGHDRDHSCG